MAQLHITGSVGKGGTNAAEDVKQIQQALNKILDLLPGIAKLAEDGSLGSQPQQSKTVAAIRRFQKRVVGMRRPDGRIDPGGRSLRILNLKVAARDSHSTKIDLPPVGGVMGLTDQDYQNAANAIGCDVAAIKAVEAVESSGAPFLTDGRPKILYEAHIFSRQTDRRYDASHPYISSRRWNRSLYVGGAGEYDRLAKAMSIDRIAALNSASWGKFQIMGFNHRASGYADVESFVADMFKSEASHLKAFIGFIQSKRLGRFLVSQNWASFARGYNGSGYAANKYDVKLQRAYDRYA